MLEPRAALSVCFADRVIEVAVDADNVFEPDLMQIVTGRAEELGCGTDS